MKFKISSLLATIALAFGMFVSGIYQAQDTPSQALLYAWQTPTTTGQLGKYIILVQNQHPAANNYSIDWSLAGTAPVACTFRVEGSFDGVNWYGLDTTSPSTTSCTTSGMESIAYRPVYYLRINIVAWTNGDVTTVARFHFTGSY
jgi:hypothetical protein